MDRLTLAAEQLDVRVYCAIVGERTGTVELAIVTRDGVIAIMVPDDGEIVVGRGEGCEVRIDDGSVSRRHASVRRGDGGVLVHDLGSANGTFVREGQAEGGATLHLRAVKDEASIAIGDAVQFGSILATVRRIAPKASTSSDGIVVREPAMRAIYEQASRAAGALISVLLLGETGVGKEVLARAIHDRSPRAKRPFLALNCAALSPTLLESELFGHEKGAFTGAVSAQSGLIESADGGTLFLDEIGELPMAVQVKLLRVLEDRTVMRVGARTTRSVDVRFLSATNRDLEDECKKGTFREDLFFRLNGIALTIPPLRERVSEIADLAALFMGRSCKAMDREPLRISPEAQALLDRHAWPGNVRELRNVMERAVVLCGGDEILASHLPAKLVGGAARPPEASSPGLLADLKSETAKLARARVLDALERCGGNQTQAAEMLGVSRRTLVSRLTEWGLTRARKKA
jgi:DNA-binding NtrC family response regulator